MSKITRLENMPAINLVVIVFSYAHEIGNQCCVKSMVRPDSGRKVCPEKCKLIFVIDII